jgi:PIN domain nuclease of toxin-antitoxin system
LFGDERLSPAAKLFFDQAAMNGQNIAFSAISLAEVVYLFEKRRLPIQVLEALENALRNPKHVLAEAPLTGAVVDSMRKIPREQIPDMPDRIVAATALHLGVPLLSRDGRIRSSLVPTIW